MAVNDDFSSKDSRVRIFPTDKGAFAATASVITALIDATIKREETSNVIVAAGNAIAQTLGFLSASDTDWRKVNWFLADERCVAHDDIRRNDKQITEVLTNSLGKNFGRIFAPNALLSPKEAAREYASRIGQISMFDFCLLGMGTDGHIASLLPNHSVLNSNEICCELYDSPNPPAERITLTLKTLGQVRNRILITTGAKKSRAVNDYVSNPRSPVRLFSPTAIFSDEAAYA